VTLIAESLKVYDDHKFGGCRKLSDDSHFTYGNVVRGVFCFRLFESALTQVCFKAYFVQPALSPPLLYARGFITVIHAAQP
jgi:hypothetical protein